MMRFIIVMIIIYTSNAQIRRLTPNLRSISDVEGTTKVSLGQTGDGLKVRKFTVASVVQSRFATTYLTSVIQNLDSTAKEIIFKAVLPSSAFISNFIMLIDGQTYLGDVREKNEAKQKYEDAKAKGQTAGLAAQSIREMNNFEISANVQSGGTVQFNLTYQEILQRVDGVYKYILNINPGQKAEITTVKVPQMQPRIGEKSNTDLLNLPDAGAEVQIDKRIDPQLSIVSLSYSPNSDAQRRTLGDNQSGQMVILYDVNRNSLSGEIQVVDGYFVQFFAPKNLPVGNKQIVFVLDTSGSMQGPKLDQLKEAMSTILRELRPTDGLNIITFDSEVRPWKPDLVAADSNNIKSALQFVQSIQAGGATAIQDALREGHQMLTKAKTRALLSMLVFLTDGDPTVGETDTSKIVSELSSWNKNTRFSVVSIAFGDDADYEFLKKLSSQNRGIARKIFVDSDTALQLRGFYQEVATPLLSEVKLKYLNETVDVDTIVTNRENDLPDGSELLAVGKLNDGLNPSGNKIAGDINAIGANGNQSFTIDHIVDCSELCQPCPEQTIIIRRREINSRDGLRHCSCQPLCNAPREAAPRGNPLPPLAAHSVGGFVERMWSYLTIRKLLDEAKYKETDPAKQEELRKRALELSLRYHFVTELTSLVVLKSRGLEDLPDYGEGVHQNGVIANFESADQAGLRPLTSPATVAPSQITSLFVTETSRAFTTSDFTDNSSESPTQASSTDVLTSNPRTSPSTTVTISLPSVPFTGEETQCSFKTVSPDEVQYDRSSLLTSDLSLFDIKGCTKLCASIQDCQFALWLPSAYECLLYSQKDLVSCSDTLGRPLVDAPAIVFCISCST